jgi:hypothetical protein
VAATVVIITARAAIEEEPVFVIPVPAAVIPVEVIPAGIPTTMANPVAAVVTKLLAVLLGIVLINDVVFEVAPLAVIATNPLRIKTLVVPASDAFQFWIAGVFGAAMIGRQVPVSLGIVPVLGTVRVLVGVDTTRRVVFVGLGIVPVLGTVRVLVGAISAGRLVLAAMGGIMGAMCTVLVVRPALAFRMAIALSVRLRALMRG